MHSLPKFKNRKLYQQSFIHRSYLNETKEKLASNERLEFLGDSILSFVVSEYLYSNYPDFTEGTLTNVRSLLVNTKTLAEAARELEFGKHLLLSKGEEEAGGRENPSLLADAFEAFIGALYLDQGINETRKFIKKILMPKAKLFIERKTFKDPKSLLQEFIQSKKQESPAYSVVKEEGPPHRKMFTVIVSSGNRILGKGKGHSKQEAEKNAASQALKVLKA